MTGSFQQEVGQGIEGILLHLQMLLQIPFLISSRIDYSCPIECLVSRAQLVEYPNVKQLRARGIPQDFHRIERLIKIDPFVYLKPKTSPFRADPPV